MPNAQKLVQHWDKLPINFLRTFIQIVWKYLLVSGTFTIFTLAFDNYEYEKFFFKLTKSLTIQFKTNKLIRIIFAA